MKNVQTVSKDNLCIFCGTCVSICPKQCLSIPFDKEYRLEVDNVSCIDCGKCLSVCPGLHVRNYHKKEQDTAEDYYAGEFRALYLARSNDYLRRYRGSSGGVLTETVMYLLESKQVDAAVLTRFAPGAPLRPEGFIAYGAADVLPSVGSKYSPVPLNLLLRNLDLEKKYVYVGLPCHLQGLDMFLSQQGKDYSGKFIKLGLFCSRTNNMEATRRLLKMNRVNPDDVSGIRYRGFGHPGVFTITFADGSKRTVPHLDPSYWGLLFKKYYVQYRCWLCPDKTAYYSDISYADDWSTPMLKDNTGNSTLVVRGAVGAEIIEKMKEAERITLEPFELPRLIRSQALPFKMNIAKRSAIAGLFGKPIPQYENFTFRKEKPSRWKEFTMFRRIRLQRSFLLRAWLPFAFFFHGLHRRLKLLFDPAFYKILIRGVFRRIEGLFVKPAGAGGASSSPAKAAPEGGSAAAEPLPPLHEYDNDAYHIVTIGGYGYNDVGDEAMPKALLHNLRERFGKRIRFTMLSPYPAFTRRYHRYPSIKDIPYFTDAADAGGMNFERARYLRWARLYLKNKWAALFFIALGNRLPFYKILRVISRAHGLLNVGGGNLNSIMRRELYRRTTMHHIAELFGKRVYVSGQTLGPYYHDNDRSVVVEALDKVDILSFRDKENSHGKVTSMGVSNPLMFDAGDDAFSLPSIPDEEAARLIREDAGEAWFGLKAKHTWALNLKASLSMFKGAGRTGELSIEVDLLARLSRYLLENYDSRVLLVSTDYCKGVDDRVVLREVYKKLPEPLKPRAAVLEKIYTDHELKGIIAFCDFAMGARYHFSVFSLARMVPTIGIASGEYQRTKLIGILNLLDLPEYFIPVDMEYAKLEEVTTVIARIVSHETAVREKLKQNVPILMKNSIRIVEHIYQNAAKDTGLVPESK